MLKKLREKCAFTLVELIVVLVILAILAALLVPALTGYIDKAKKEQTIADTRMLLTAVQTEMSELYGTDQWNFSGGLISTIVSKDGTTSSGNTPANSAALKSNYENLTALAELPNIQNGNARFFSAVDLSGKAYLIIYDTGKGYVGLYFNDTQEYMALKTSETPYLNDYFTYLTNKVVVSNTKDSANSIGAFSKIAVLVSLGYPYSSN